MARDAKYGALYTEDDVLLLLRRLGVEDPHHVLRRDIGRTFAAEEPLFLLRGKDTVAEQTVRSYGADARSQGAPAEHVHAVEQVADEFARFRAEYPELVGTPD